MELGKFHFDQWPLSVPLTQTQHTGMPVCVQEQESTSQGGLGKHIKGISPGLFTCPAPPC